MELGVTICTPQSPHCADCPVRRWCQANARGLTNEIPEPRRKRAAVSVRIAAAILRDPQGRTLLVKNPGAHDHVLFSRMWQFPAVEVKRHLRVNAIIVPVENYSGLRAFFAGVKTNDDAQIVLRNAESASN